MDSFEINKILGAILGTCLFTLALNITAGAIFTPEKLAVGTASLSITTTGGGTGAVERCPGGDLVAPFPISGVGTTVPKHDRAGA